MTSIARSSSTKRSLIATSLVLLVLPSLAAQTKIDKDKIYYGDARKHKSAVVVDAQEVYQQIPAHQELVRRKLTRDDPDYWPLMRKASQIFVRALRKVCQKEDYDLVGEVGSITIDGKKVPEITSDVIKILNNPKSKTKATKEK